MKNEKNPTCYCGHNHDQHGKSTSVNYSAGKCSHKNCGCRRFIIDSPVNNSVKKHQLNDDLNEFVNQLSGTIDLETYKIIKNRIGSFVNKKFK